MAKSIVARRKGDTYQARVFWLKLLELRTGDFVESVTLESDDVSFVDDVVVSYNEPTLDPLTRRREIRQELIQCKYHMTLNNALNHENLIDPRFIHCKNSMLQRLYDAYIQLSRELGRGAFRLYIRTNWHWDHNDPLAKHLHEEMFRCNFYEQGPRSKVGKILSKWSGHLCISQETLRPFLDTVRFNLGKNLTDLAREMTAHLAQAELKPFDSSVTHNHYDDLAWKLLGQGCNTFDRESFDRMIREEQLLLLRPTPHSEISIQSFSQFARRPRDLQARHLDLRSLFEHRLSKDDGYWRTEIPDQISSFLLSEDLIELPQPIHLFFDCHLSIAFFAGHLISPKHRIEIVPTQSLGSDYEPWSSDAPDNSNRLWEFQTVKSIGNEVVLGISVTRDVQKQTQSYLETKNLTDLPQIMVFPIQGVSPTAVVDGDHAWQLGSQLETQLRQMLPVTSRTIHLFYAGPVALAYILGHRLRYVTESIQLYEFDFEGQSGEKRYYPSLRVS